MNGEPQVHSCRAPGVREGAGGAGAEPPRDGGSQAPGGRELQPDRNKRS